MRRLATAVFVDLVLVFELLVLGVAAAVLRGVAVDFADLDLCAAGRVDGLCALGFTGDLAFEAGGAVVFFRAGRFAALPDGFTGLA